MVPITKGLYCQIDAPDAEAVLSHRWMALNASGRIYATSASVGLMHRWLLDAPRGVYVDHKNGDPLDNRRSNIRLATVSENGMNSRVRRGMSRFKGVCHSRGKWAARIKKNGQRTWLGTFKTQLEAALAYDTAAVALFGEFAAPNFPERFRN